MKKKNIDTSNINENLKNPRTRAFIFFGFYLIFFIVLFVMLGNNQTEPLKQEEKESTDITYKFNQINKQNYHFKYQIILDEVTTVFEGDKEESKENFKVIKDNQEKEYFNNDNIFLAKNDTWTLATSPYLYSNFLDAKEINRFLKNSTFISKTEYSNKEVCYQYQISTTTIVSLLEDKDIDLMDLPNTINLWVRDDEVYKIELDISSYIQYKEPDYQKLKMIMEYSNFDEIEGLKTPEYTIG